MDSNGLSDPYVKFRLGHQKYKSKIDLSALSREQTHKLELQLEEGEGHLVLLVTLTASATVSISDLSVNSREDQKEREEILKRYV
ncbi:MCTP1, partial [Cervus elaphus hippelaphus]